MRNDKHELFRASLSKKEMKWSAQMSKCRIFAGDLIELSEKLWLVHRTRKGTSGSRRGILLKIPNQNNMLSFISGSLWRE